MFIFPKLVEKKNSRFNGAIKVHKLFGKHSISVDNLTQSGGLLVPIWRKALKIVTSYQLPVTNCLILGLGGGTAAKLVSQNWPKAKITAIEIDPTMVDLGKKYMGLNQVANLKIIVGDAFKKIYQLPLRPHSGRAATSHQLILVDTYQGKNYPGQAKSKDFISKLKKLLSPQGIIIFNRLNWESNEPDIHRHMDLLKEYFSSVTSQKVLSNTLVFCSNSK